nr:flavin reductase family protein [Bacteroidia bacterium]
QDYYCRASGNALFEVTKPNLKMGIGIDQIPAHIRNSDVLSGNDLGQLGNVESIPDQQAISEFGNMEEIRNLSAVINANPESKNKALHLAAKALIQAGKIDDAWKLLLHFS